MIINIPKPANQQTKSLSQLERPPHHHYFFCALHIQPLNRITKKQPTVLSTGRRQKKASRVFGDVVFNDSENSLTYSPSPSPVQPIIKRVEHHDVSSPQPTVLFERDGQSIPSKGRHVSFVTDKENSNGNIQVSNSPAARKSSIDSFRSAELSRLRASFQSPQRRDLVKKTQLAISNATTSVNQSLNHKKSRSINETLNATRKAKEEAMKSRANKTKTVRFQWEEENAKAKSFYEKVEENRRQILAVQRKLASGHFKEKAKRDNEKRKKQISKLEQEYTFNAEVHREQQQKLKKANDRNRKKSIETRAKLRQNKREGEERMKKIKEEEEAAIHEVRYDLHKSRNEVARSNNEARRKSFQFRAGDARRIRNIRSQWREDELSKQHESFELSRAAAKDVEAYQKKVRDERRDSIRFRNQEARNICEETQRKKEAALQAEHESYELKWAGEKDAEAYKRQMQEERRKSLAGRNKESVRHAKVMEELRNLAQEEQAESFMLKWAGEKDAEAYIAKMAEERRKSQQFRGEEAKRHRLLKEEEHFKSVEKSLAEASLQSDCK